MSVPQSTQGTQVNKTLCKREMELVNILIDVNRRDRNARMIRQAAKRAKMMNWQMMEEFDETIGDLIAESQ